MSKTINVDLKDDFYEVIIDSDSIKNLYKFIDVSRHVFIITDKNVERLYLDVVKNQFVSADYFSLTPGEASKSFIDLIAILNRMQQLKLDRRVLVIGLGGGVVGDIAGLVAALYLRGVDYLAIPTTTLAQIDSSVGGKVAINLNGIKNVVGTFYQPIKVIIDKTVLKTLPLSEYNAGLVEAVKIGLLCDAELFKMLLNLNIKTNIEEIIKRSVKCKRDLVRLDERDHSKRQLLNLGHTLGHAIEAKYNYSHGQSIMLGMIYTVKDLDIKSQLITIAKKLDLTYQIELSDDLYDYMQHDKKISDDKINLALVDEIGAGYLKSVPKTSLWELLDE